jgi:hypothetical protein
MGLPIIQLNPFEGVFGLPPASHVSDTMIINSMPQMEIVPGTPHFETGLNLFRVNEDWPAYEKVLAAHGFSLPSRQIKLAFIADNFPTDTFTNEYGETFLQKFTDVASSGMQQLAQMSGATRGTEAFGNIGGQLETFGGNVGGALGDIIAAGGSGAKSLAEQLQRMKSAMNAGGGPSFLQGAAESIDKMLGGARVDFPQIWRNSAWTPSYTATIRLYNPNPGKSGSTKRHIVGPLAVILCLATPRSDDGKTFNWPFFHRIKAQGIYGLDPCVITSVTVVKGGDQQQISFNQKLAMVDVRIDFTSLYGTMVVEEGKTNAFANRPTLKKYLDNLEEIDSTLSFKRNAMNEKAGNSAAVGGLGPNVKISSRPTAVTDAAAQNSVANVLAKNIAASRRQAPKVTDVQVDNRVSSASASLAAALESRSSPDFIV